LVAGTNDGCQVLSPPGPFFVSWTIAGSHVLLPPGPFLDSVPTAADRVLPACGAVEPELAVLCAIAAAVKPADRIRVSVIVEESLILRLLLTSARPPWPDP